MRRGKRKLAILLAVSLFAGILQPMPTTYATEDAIVVDNSHMTREEQMEHIINLFKGRLQSEL